MSEVTERQYAAVEDGEEVTQAANTRKSGRKPGRKPSRSNHVATNSSTEDKSNKKMKKFLRVVVSGLLDAGKSATQALIGSKIERMPESDLKNLLGTICPGLELDPILWRNVTRGGQLVNVDAYSKFSDYMHITLEDAHKLVTDGGRYRVVRSELQRLLRSNSRFSEVYATVRARYEAALEKKKKNHPSFSNTSVKSETVETINSDPCASTAAIKSDLPAPGPAEPFFPPYEPSQGDTHSPLIRLPTLEDSLLLATNRLATIGQPKATSPPPITAFPLARTSSPWTNLLRQVNDSVANVDSSSAGQNSGPTLTPSFSIQSIGKGSAFSPYPGRLTPTSSLEKTSLEKTIAAAAAAEMEIERPDKAPSVENMLMMESAHLLLMRDVDISSFEEDEIEDACCSQDSGSAKGSSEDASTSSHSASSSSSERDAKTAVVYNKIWNDVLSGIEDGSIPQEKFQSLFEDCAQYIEKLMSSERQVSKPPLPPVKSFLANGSKRPTNSG